MYPTQKPDQQTTYLCMVEGKTPPKRHHKSYKEAKEECQRLTKITGKPTYLLMVMKKYESEITETNFKHKIGNICDECKSTNLEQDEYTIYCNDCGYFITQTICE